MSLANLNMCKEEEHNTYQNEAQAKKPYIEMSCLKEKHQKELQPILPTIINLHSIFIIMSVFMNGATSSTRQFEIIFGFLEQPEVHIGIVQHLTEVVSPK